MFSGKAANNCTFASRPCGRHRLMEQTSIPASLIIFASGNGSNAEAIIRYFAANGKAVVKLLVCNNPQAGVLQIAQRYGIHTILVDKTSFLAPEFITQLQSVEPDLLILAGFLWKVPSNVIAAFPGRIINIHPALLPKFGGKGMYGKKVHEAVLQSGEQESGITIHYVNDHYDEGGRILQACCSVLAGDTAETVAAKVARLEHAFYPKTIEYLLGEQ